MNEDETRLTVVRHLMAKADQALPAARRDCGANDRGLAANRVYYACFYALSAVLLKEKQQFTSHSGLRGAMHQHLIRSGRLAKELGQFYDRAFTERQEADYNAMATFQLEVVEQRIAGAEHFLAEMKHLLG